MCVCVWGGGGGGGGGRYDKISKILYFSNSVCITHIDLRVEPGCNCVWFMLLFLTNSLHNKILTI
jgi:hypothetical protein